MLHFTEYDEKEIRNAYHNFLINLKKMIKEKDFESNLECAVEIMKMINSGYFSMNKTINFDSTFNYLPFSSNISEGIEVMYGIACCRHASALLNDILEMLGFSSSLLYILIDKDDNWHVSEAIKANHVTVLLKEIPFEYILDPRNKFVCKIENDKSLTQVNLNNDIVFPNYQDSLIQSIGKTLKKYYQLQDLGINHNYDYRY